MSATARHHAADADILLDMDAEIDYHDASGK